MGLHRYTYPKFNGITSCPDSQAGSSGRFKEVSIWLPFHVAQSYHGLKLHTRLGVLISNVLNMEPFASKKRAWNTLFLKPFMTASPRASMVVANLMHRIMIRNRREDISKDVVLPELKKRLVFLDFDYYQWMVSCIFHFTDYITFQSIVSSI